MHDACRAAAHGRPDNFARFQSPSHDSAVVLVSRPGGPVNTGIFIFVDNSGARSELCSLKFYRPQLVCFAHRFLDGLAGFPLMLTPPWLTISQSLPLCIGIFLDEPFEKCRHRSSI
jgi:hypothetical protein